MSNSLLQRAAGPSGMLLTTLFVLSLACGDDSSADTGTTANATSAETEGSATASASASADEESGNASADESTSGDGDSGDGDSGDGDGDSGDGDSGDGDSGDGDSGDGDSGDGDSGDGDSGDGDSGDGDSGDGDSGDGDSGDGDGDGGDGDSGDGDGDGDTTTTGDGDTGGSPCDKVDILFVIDHSGSMSEEQSALLAAFPDFANAMIATLDTVESLHVGVAASGPFTANDPGNCAVNGALVAQTACLPFVDGNRFITESDDIVAAFDCNAQLGTSGPGDNNTMFNVVSGVSAMAAPGECNENFMRDDALLVIVIITDEEDDHDIPAGFGYLGSPGDPADWVADVVAAKDGVETNVVVASFVQPPEPNTCPAGNNGSFQIWYEANRIIEFTNSFSNSLVHDICDTSGYQDGFDEALAYIDIACEGFKFPE